MLGILTNYGDFFLKGTANTLLLALSALFFGTILGFLLALVRMGNKYVGLLSTAYIEFVRGTPLYTQAVIIYYLPSVLNLGFELNIDKFVAGIVALSLNSAAYVAEIVRAGINSVDKGQMEAARSLGMPRGLAMREIVLPQAFKNILPSLGNEFIAVIKESSIISVIGVTELMFEQGVVRSITYSPLYPLFIASIIYFVITFTLSKVVGAAERRMKVSD
jgi:His/Glu/Gln/Arg/opine family amino acid ABC transporter permease subunit